MAANDSKKLVLGLLSRMCLEHARPFFLSLEKAGYDGDVCMIVSEIDPATQAFLRARHVEIIPFQGVRLKRFWARLARLPGLFMPPDERRLLESVLASTSMHPHCARHFFYQSYLEECGANYSHVLVTDVRDVLFQADPFAFKLPDGLAVFLADRSKTIGNCSHNTHSMLRGFGRGMWRELHDKPIACAGTTLGTTTAIRDHVSRVVEILCAKNQRETIDQSVHNYLVHKQPPARLQMYDNYAGPVLTMAYIDPARVPFNDRGQIINSDGSVINTLHQYDRHPALASRLLPLLT